MWDRAVDGRILNFHLLGVNNQNFLMTDEETGSWWQQITGECILGPLKGKRLRRINSDEVSLAIWRGEHPASSIVKFDPKYAAKYVNSEWETRIGKIPTPPGMAAGPIGLREQVVGIELDGVAVAYPLAALRKRSPVSAQVGSTPVSFLVAADGNSVRCFIRPRLNGQPLEFYRRAEDGTLVDGTTGSSWSFAGVATAGSLAGKTLEAVQTTKDYWFDWRVYHPSGVLRQRGI